MIKRTHGDLFSMYLSLISRILYDKSMHGFTIVSFVSCFCLKINVREGNTVLLLSYVLQERMFIF